MQDNERPRRLRPAQAATYAGLSKSTLDKMRVLGNGPAFFKIGRASVYQTDDIDAWLAQRRRTSTSDIGGR